MKLKNIKQLDKFRDAINKCQADVFLKSPEGDVLNLKSSLSQYIALGQLLGEAGDSLELFTNCREDESIMLEFMMELADDQRSGN